MLTVRPDTVPASDGLQSSVSPQNPVSTGGFMPAIPGPHCHPTSSVTCSSPLSLSSPEREVVTRLLYSVNFLSVSSPRRVNAVPARTREPLIDSGTPCRTARWPLRIDSDKSLIPVSKANVARPASPAPGGQGLNVSALPGPWRTMRGRMVPHEGFSTAC